MGVMNKLATRFFCVVLIASAISLPAAAQEWSRAQQEVWEFEKACWSDRTPQFTDKCFHSDFQGWGVGSTVPTSKADRAVMSERDRATEDNVFLFLKPLVITVHGNMAVALYIATSTSKNKTTGEEKTVTERWTDVLVTDNGAWSWIADHGADITTE